MSRKKKDVEEKEGEYKINLPEDTKLDLDTQPTPGEMLYESSQPVKVQDIPIIDMELELTGISKSEVRYRAVNKCGIENDIHHIAIPRRCFPDDENFSLDFINANLDAKSTDPNAKMFVTKAELAAIERMKTKQAEYRKLAKLKLYIYS